MSVGENAAFIVNFKAVFVCKYKSIKWWGEVHQSKQVPISKAIIKAFESRLPLSRFDRRSSYWYTSLPSKIRKILWKVALGNVCFFICCLRVCFDSKVPNKEFWKKPLKIAFLADFSITLIKGLYLFLLWAEDGREKLSQRGGTILSHNFLSGQP